ncbi:hypothetical protein COCON_G00084990 [Conger conger]|uniref:Uncharacterized protein n=1 Tax=Conger conger TaxID=82655 RepID=A0A9Q1DQF3_CONCO|nr:hypothetical protein COCON_G00084990 [Conger conger]
MNEGLYYCVNETDKKSQMKLEIQKVYQEPAELMEGGNGSVVCAVSHVKEGTRLLWIEVESQQKFASADGFGIEFALSVRNVTLKRSAWVCAVFYKDRLRALLPLNLTIKRQPTQPDQPNLSTELSAGARIRSRAACASLRRSWASERQRTIVNNVCLESSN